MALGTTTLIATGNGDAGQVYVDRITVVLDNSYPTGGYTGLATKIQGATNRNPTILGVVSQSSGYVAQWDYANSKLMLFYSNDDGGADGVLIQVADGADVGAITLSLLVFYK